MSENQDRRPVAIDVHQHLWPEELVDRLRARSRAPYVRGWTLHTDGEPAYHVDPLDHEPGRRVKADREAGVGTACVALSAPLGVEGLPRPHADLLLDAWRRGVDRLPEHFRAWASVPALAPDLGQLGEDLAQQRYAGLQVPATQLLTPAAWERAEPLLHVAERAGKPVLVHPGPVGRVPFEGALPAWWAPVVGYVGQLQAAWWAWQAYAGRHSLPSLRLVFAAGAGLAPVHHERHAQRGGVDRPVDAGVFVDTSGYGPRALDALVRVLGIDALVLGSDRPYGTPVGELFGDAATHAVRVANPGRLLGTGPAQHEHEQEGERTWAFAS